MKKRILTLGLALAISVLGTTKVFAVTDDTDGSSDQTGNSVTTPSPSLDTSKITSTNASAKNALISTLESHMENPDTSTENGRKLSQLLNSVKQGHAISVNLIVNEGPEISGSIQGAITTETAGLNLAAVDEIKFVVDDAGSSVELTSLADPVTVTFPVPSLYKTELRSRTVEIIHIYQESNGSYVAESIPSPTFDNNGDITFKTSSFGYFVLAYSGEPIVVTADGDIAVPSTSAAGANTSTTTNTSAPTATTTPTYTTATIPDTSGFFGFDLTVFHLLLIIAIALVATMIIAYAIRRAYIRHRISLK